MVVSQSDWIPSELRLNLWGRISLFLCATIVIIIAMVSIQEYLQIYVGEYFSNMALVPTRDPTSYFPLNLIVPAEYIRPSITAPTSATIHHHDSMTTRNRFL